MLTTEDNALLTQTGPGTPMGELMRRYWQPVARVEEVEAGGAPLSLKLFSEDLVLFRDDGGRAGLLGLRCSHRRADLSYGRVENGGLRCLYHGWLYDVHGSCLEQPGEPKGSDFHKQIRHPAYPCRELGGLIFTYMGPGEPPLLPSFDALVAPENQRNIFKAYQESNYLSGVEGNLDPAHVSFLHRLIGKSEQKAKIDQYALKGQGGGPGAPAVTDIWGEDVSPTIEFESSDFGIRYASLRKAGPEKRYIRGGNWIMPNLVAAPGPTAADGYTLSWHVPIDDAQSWRYSYTYRRGGPMDPEGLLKKEHASEMGPGHRPIRNKANRFLQDREQMKTSWASGFGPSVVIQDVAMTDLQGAVPNHDEERLGYTDRVIVATRLMMLKAARDLKAGREPVRDGDGRGVAFPVVVSDVIPNSEDWKAYYRRRVKEEETIAANVHKIRP